MRDKIERLSRGEFEYDLPMLCLSESEIKVDCEAGKVYEGSLTVKNSAEKSMKGVLYSSHRLFILKTDSFQGTTNTISYQLDATYLKAGDALQGELTIVSDCGEHMIPFMIQVEAPYCNTSIGKVGDLFQFANLARMDWTEAKKVFRSEDFEHVILRNDEKHKILYRNLLKNISTSQALEEFLIAIHKKSKIELSIDKTNLEYSVSDEDFMDKLILTKNHWGYAEIRVSTDSPFIKLEQKFVWADRFISNTHHISFGIVPQNMRPGNNYGKILITTVYQTITVEIICKYHQHAKSEQSLTEQHKKTKLGFIRNYLDFRTERISLSQYLGYTEALLKEMAVLPGSNLEKLMRIHLAVISGKNKTAGLLLVELAKEEVILKKNIVEYCAYLYLDAMYHKDSDTIKKVTDIIHHYYSNGHSDWRILWFLLYTDKRYDKNKSLRLSDIKEQYEAGCYSPILYYEAVLTYQEEPFLLRDLGDFEIQVLNFGIKEDILSKEVAIQYTYLANKRKNLHPLIYQGLERLYKTYGSDEILTAICCMLIKGIKKSETYFKWYSLGVEAQLRITELYEYYMYSVDDRREAPLPQPILLYFIYNSSLNDRKRAFLYANVIKNKEKLTSIYRTYYKRMEVFTLKMLETHNISPNLAVLYREFMNKSGISTEMAEHLPYVIFTQALRCDNPKIVSVLVNHKETGEEEGQLLTNGEAYIQMYTRDTDIFLNDAFGNRYAVSVDYTLKPIFPMEEQEYIDLDYLGHPKLLLHIYEYYTKNRVLNEKAVALWKQISLIQGLQDEYYVDCLNSLIDYYYENYNEELLEHYLSRLDIGKVKEADRTKFIEYMAIRGHYSKALIALLDYGFEGISVKRLLRICSGWITDSGYDTKQEYHISLCYYIFSQGKYDEAILGYLVKYYYGPTDNMFNLWVAAKDFELDTHRLEERLLVQMLFVEGYMKDSFEVFSHYYKNVTNRLLVKAFLTFYAYKYLVHDRIINKELFPIMRRELNYEANDICLIAWMKYNTTNRKLTMSERDYISYSISRLEKKGIVLPFFMDYHKGIKLPERLSDKVYIEYKTNPKKQVYIHYRLAKNNSEGEYITELMPDVLLGIHVKEIVLFFHELLQYYISEEYDGEVNVTESFHLRFDKEISEEEESKYNQINLMLMAMEMQDETSLIDIMEHYVKSEHIIKKCFKPIA